MKIRILFLLCLTVLVFISGVAACGSKSDMDQTAAGVEQADAEVQESAAAEEDSADQLLGKWIDISSPDRFANITKADTGYEYEDNEGKYSAAFEDGVLKVKVSDNDTADVFIDKSSGHLFTVFQGNQAEFSKK